jgi:hypothetical protein
MNPLTQERLAIAALAAATALLLAAPANASAQQPVVPDAVDRAVAAQSTADNGPAVLRKSGTVVVVGAEQPAWLQALEARSQAMNDFYGITTTTSVRPDDRAAPRPAPVGPTGPATSASGDDGTEWGDVAMGALGGFGIGLFLIGGTLLALRNRRHDGGVALP